MGVRPARAVGLRAEDLDSFAGVVLRVLQRSPLSEPALRVYAFRRASAPVINRGVRREAINDEVLTLRKAQDAMAEAVSAALSLLLLQGRVRLIGGLYYSER